MTAALAGLSREVEIDVAHAALLFIDVQNYTARPDGGEYAAISEAEREARYGFFFRTLRETAVPNMQRLQAACRRARSPPSGTQDVRRSLPAGAGRYSAELRNWKGESGSVAGISR